MPTMPRFAPALALLLATAGCGDAPSGGEPRSPVASPTAVTPPPPSPPPAAADTAVTDGWLGRWVGVEGLVLTIARGDAPATYRLHVVLMDGENDYIGTAQAEAIRFERDGKTETIRHTNGEGTSLKWLAGKTDCLVITPGEGFCRG